MKRFALVLAAAVVGLLAASAQPANAAARCVPVPDLEGHVWQLCLR